MPLVALFLIFLGSSAAYSVTLSEFQTKLDSLNFLLGQHSFGAIEKLEVQAISDLEPKDEPYLDIKDFRKLQIHLHQLHLMNSKSLYAILSDLASVLEHPLDEALKFSNSTGPNNFHALLKLLKSDRTLSLLDLLDFAMEDESHPVIRLRRQIFSLVRWENSQFVLERRFLQDRFFEEFPGVKLNMAELQALAKDASIQLSHIYRKYPWKKNRDFQIALGSPQILQMISRNDRAGVARYLESKMPFEFMTTRETAIWREQLEAIRNPIPENTVILFRGGQQEGFFVSSVLKSRDPEPSQGYRPAALVAQMNFSSGFTNALYRHTFSTGPHFISTTTDGGTAFHFSERRGELSALKIDWRRTIASPFRRWSENEYFTPLVIFPDEILETAQGSQRARLVRKYQKRAESDDSLILTRYRLSSFGRGRMGNSCHQFHR